MSNLESAVSSVEVPCMSLVNGVCVTASLGVFGSPLVGSDALISSVSDCDVTVVPRC